MERRGTSSIERMGKSGCLKRWPVLSSIGCDFRDLQKVVLMRTKTAKKILRGSGAELGANIGIKVTTSDPFCQTLFKLFLLSGKFPYFSTPSVLEGVFCVVCSIIII